MKQNKEWRLLANYTDGNDGKEPYAVHLVSKHYQKRWLKWQKAHPTVEVRSRTVTVLDRPSEFDELAVGDWLHIEQMNHDSYWMLVGGYRLWIDLSGKSVSVTNDGKELSDYGVVRDE